MEGESRGSGVTFTGGSVIAVAKPFDEPRDAPAETAAGDAEDEEVDGEVDVVEELADLLGQHQLLAVHRRLLCEHAQQDVQAQGVAGKVQHEKDGGHPHQHLGGAHLRLRHDAHVCLVHVPLQEEVAGGVLLWLLRQGLVTSAEAAQRQDDSRVEDQDGGEGDDERDEDVSVGEEGKEMQVGRLLLAGRVEGSDGGSIRGEEAVEVEHEGKGRHHPDGHPCVALGAQDWCAQRVADDDVALDHQQHQVPDGQEAAGVGHVHHHLPTHREKCRYLGRKRERKVGKEGKQEVSSGEKKK